MNTRIISDYKQIKDCPGLVQFSVIFTDGNDKKEEFIFFSFYLSDCVKKCAAFINYMFQIKGMNYVYIFPINSTLSFRNVYRRNKRMGEIYELIRCQQDEQLTLDKVQAIFLGF